MIQFTDAYNGGQAYIVDYRDILSLYVIPTGDSAGFKVQVWLKATRVSHVAILESKPFPTVEEANKEAADIADKILKEKEGVSADKEFSRFIPYNQIRLLDIAVLGKVSNRLSNCLKSYCKDRPAGLMLCDTTKQELLKGRMFGKMTIGEFEEYRNEIMRDGGMYF